MTGNRFSGPALLFCPATRPDRFAKAMDRADMLIVDLEDAVAASEKDTARERMLEVLPELDMARTIVRVNPLDTDDGQRDLAALAETAVQTVMLPKATDAAQLGELASFGVIALCETAAGVLHAPELARLENCIGLMWGGEDLMASLGGRASRRADGTYHDVVRLARAQILQAARAYEKAAIDAVYLAIDDLLGLSAESEEAATVGFTAKACVHPSHAAPIRAAFSAGDEQLRWARRVLAAAESHPDQGVFTHAGQMIDAPLLRHAETIVAAAAAIDAGDQ
jgi:citrate lyase subunit beta/citryl-CoA lyase